MYLYFCLELTSSIAAVKLKSQQPTKQYLPPLQQCADYATFNSLPSCYFWKIPMSFLVTLIQIFVAYAFKLESN